MKIECYFLLLVILTATVMNCASEKIRKSDVGQGKKKHMSHSHIINIRSVVHPLPVLRIKSRKKSR